MWNTDCVEPLKAPGPSDPSGPRRKVKCRPAKNIAEHGLPQPELTGQSLAQHVNPQYLQILIFKRLLLAKCICHPQIDTHGTSSTTCRQARRERKNLSELAHGPSWRAQGDAECPCSAHSMNKCSFHGLFAIFFIFLCFCVHAHVCVRMQAYDVTV